MPRWTQLSSMAERATAPRASVGFPTVDGIAVEFRSERGMIDHAKLRLAALLARERDLFAVAPLLRSVEVTEVDEAGIAALLACPWFPRLRSLELSWYVRVSPYSNRICGVVRAPAAITATRSTTGFRMAAMIASQVTEPKRRGRSSCRAARRR